MANKTNNLKEKNAEQDIDIAVLKTSLNSLSRSVESNHKEIREEIKDLKDNHLTHIYEQIGSLKDSVTNVRVRFAKYIGIAVGVLFMIEFLVNNTSVKEVIKSINIF